MITGATICCLYFSKNLLFTRLLCINYFSRYTVSRTFQWISFISFFSFFLVWHFSICLFGCYHNIPLRLANWVWFEKCNNFCLKNAYLVNERIVSFRAISYYSQSLRVSSLWMSSYMNLVWFQCWFWNMCNLLTDFFSVCTRKWCLYFPSLFCNKCRKET